MPKIVLIGVGSVTFGAGTIGDLIYFKDELAGSTVSLVDIDKDILDLMHGLADKMNDRAGRPFRIEASTNRREVLKDADFVITSPAIRREELWEKDWEIIHGAGIRQTYGENGGPGCLSHTLRNIPMMMAIFRDVEELAPRAWIINFTNPEARICMTMDRYTSLKFVGLCHQIYEGYRTVSHVLQIPQEDLDVKAAGINHFTWIYDVCRKSTGRSVLNDFLRKLAEMPPAYEPLSRRLYNTYGMFPTAGDDHLAEYLSYGWEYVGLAGRDFAMRRRKKAELVEWLRGVEAGMRTIEERISGRTSESVVDIIVAMTKGRNKYEVSMDLHNGGCIPNLPEDAIVEVPGVVSRDSARGLRMEPLPEGIAAMMRQQIAVQGLSIAAAIKGDRKLALQAMLLDPVVDASKTAEIVLDKLLEAHRDYISPDFFR